jgi:hypothetical protein
MADDQAVSTVDHVDPIPLKAPAVCSCRPSRPFRRARIGCDEFSARALNPWIGSPTKRDPHLVISRVRQYARELGIAPAGVFKKLTKQFNNAANR